jgi:uncharacterized SAM-binding protein YcdF (DUF218 family)
VVHGHREGNAVGGRVDISEEAIARVRRAERVARERRIERILFCGAGAPGHPSEARQMAALWRGPAIQILLDERSTDTAENAAEALWWARELGVPNLIVVSSWWHLRLPAYYRSAPGIKVSHARCWRWDQPLRRLRHELRYLPRVARSRKAAGQRPTWRATELGPDMGRESPG